MRHSCPAASATAPPLPGALVVRLACLSQQAPQFFQASKLLGKSPKSMLFTVVLVLDQHSFREASRRWASDTARVRLLDQMPGQDKLFFLPADAGTSTRMSKQPTRAFAEHEANPRRGPEAHEGTARERGCTKHSRCAPWSRRRRSRGRNARRTCLHSPLEGGHDDGAAPRR